MVDAVVCDSCSFTVLTNVVDRLCVWSTWCCVIVGVFSLVLTPSGFWWDLRRAATKSCELSSPQLRCIVREQKGALAAEVWNAAIVFHVLAWPVQLKDRSLGCVFDNFVVCSIEAERTRVSMFTIKLSSALLRRYDAYGWKSLAIGNSCNAWVGAENGSFLRFVREITQRTLSYRCYTFILARFYVSTIL